MSDVVLDASALVALLRGEPGADIVAARLGGAAISAANLAEAHGRILREVFDPDGLHRDIMAFGLDIRPFDTEQAFIAGALEPATRPLGLALGDRACLALARSLGRPALTADRQWLEADLGIPIELIR